MKTTRHFEENNTSFLGKSPISRSKIKKIDTGSLHKYKHKEDFSSTKNKVMCRKREKRWGKTKKKQ